VTILDVNVLIYAHDADAPQHAAAKVWLEKLFLSSERVVFPWVVIWGFLRVSTNRHIQARPRTPPGALDRVKDWLKQPNVSFIEPGLKHLDVLEQLVKDYQISGPQMSDAVLAALAIEHGATLASTDRGFRRFTNLRWVNPLDER
jgi:uncharacterized protein